MNPLVVIADCDHGDIVPERAVLREAGFRIKLYQCRTADDVVACAKGAVGLISQAAPIKSEAIVRLPMLRVIGRYGVGLDNIDLTAATARGIRVVHVPDFCTDEVADHAMTLILAMLRRVPVLDHTMRGDTTRFAAQWPRRLRVLRGVARARDLVLGIIGYGRIGRAVSQRAHGFGFRLVGYDRYVPPEVLKATGIELLPLEGVLRSADVLTLHVPLTGETATLIGEAQLKLMRPSAILVNTSRGGVVDEEALVRALREGWIAGAALDVVAQEPPPFDHPLLTAPNVLYTPHIAFYSDRSIRDVKRRVAEYVAAALSGNGKYVLANPEVEQ